VSSNDLYLIQHNIYSITRHSINSSTCKENHTRSIIDANKCSYSVAKASLLSHWRSFTFSRLLEAHAHSYLKICCCYCADVRTHTCTHTTQSPSLLILSVSIFVAAQTHTHTTTTTTTVAAAFCYTAKVTRAFVGIMCSVVCSSPSAYNTTRPTIAMCSSTVALERRNKWSW
jgi:hypothetical protein